MVSNEKPPSSILRFNIYDSKVRGLISQIIVIVLFTAFSIYIINNTAANLVDRGISTGFNFINAPAGYDVSQMLILFEEPITHGQMFVIGLLNTAVVAVLGVFLATIIGLLFGIMRLSNNWLAAGVAYVYVDSLRNVPILLQILFWYGILLTLPGVRQSIVLADVISFNNRGLFLPAPVFNQGFSLVLFGFISGLVITIVLVLWSKRRQRLTGQSFPAGFYGTLLTVLLVFVSYFISGSPLSWDIPELKGFSFRGGFVISPEFTALLLALVFYTATYIAEILRSAIESVSAGQKEAAAALGLQPGQMMKLILIPQALRVAIPQLTSQYLNLTKNSSLAVAIGYPDLVATFGGTTLNQTGQAVEVIAITMAVYLIFSLVISLFMNWFNAHVALKER
ncbi:amino acid ABC transporter permease [Kiloniella sp.]|uniref:amino acid ABC transporter permease n=1 Tax=Kiloniella sp. TaxID=1938587 RepID=UPI003B017AD4